MSDPLWPHGLQPTRLLCPRNFPGKNTRVGCHFLLHGNFLIQRSNPHLLHLLHCQGDSLPQSHLRSLSLVITHRIWDTIHLLLGTVLLGQWQDCRTSYQWRWKMCASFLSYLEISAVLEKPQGPEQSSEGFQICHYFQIRIFKVQEVGGGWWDDTVYKILSRYWSSPNQETSWTKVDAPGEQHPLFHSEDLKWWRQRTVAWPESVTLECLGGFNPATALESPDVIPLMPSSGWPWREKKRGCLGDSQDQRNEKKKKIPLHWEMRAGERQVWKQQSWSEYCFWWQWW